MSRATDRIGAFVGMPKEDERQEKFDILSELEGITEDGEIVPFLVQTAADPEQSDLVRMEALTVLKARSFSDQASKGAAGRAVAGLAADAEGDPEVRNYAMMALANFMELPEADVVVLKVLSDTAEGSVLRHNAFFAVERGGPSDVRRQVLESLRSEKEFAGGADRVMKQWSAQ